MPVTLFVTMPVKPEHLDEACDRFAEAVRATREEDGCLAYVAARAEDGSPDIRVFERWRDDEALKAHGRAPHMRAFGAAARDFFSGPVTITRYVELVD